MISFLFTVLCYLKKISPSFRIINSVDKVLQLSELFGVPAYEPGILVVEFIFSVVWQLLVAALDDEGLLELGPEKKFGWIFKPENMDIDGHGCYNEKRTTLQERLKSVNTVMAIELFGQFLQNKVTFGMLHLARRNM